MANPKTYVNGSAVISEWNYTAPNSVEYDLFEAYLNGTIVFKKSLELYLPDPQGVNTTINLKTFIDGEDTGGFTNIKIINNFIQPQIITGVLTGLNIEFENNSEIQGNTEGSAGLILTSDILLINNGWIRGAGGGGGLGGPTDAFYQSVGAWLIRHHETSGCPSILSPRYWHEGGNRLMEWMGATATGVCMASTKGPFSTVLGAGTGSSIGQWECIIWGDQDKCVLYHELIDGSPAVWKWRDGTDDGGAAGSISMVYSEGYSVGSSGGGVGGNGQVYRAAATGGLLGPLPTTSGPSSGFNASTGVTLDLPSASERRGGRGGTGGTWGNSGLQGETSPSNDAGQLGSAGGVAIIGSSHLLLGSAIGNTSD